NIDLESVESWLEGDLDVQGFLGLNDKMRNGYQEIRGTFNIKGDLTEEEKRKLESFVRLSPVFDIVTNKGPVAVRLQYCVAMHGLGCLGGGPLSPRLRCIDRDDRTGVILAGG